MVAAAVVGGALILAACVAASAASSWMLGNKETMTNLVDENPTAFEPRLLWGDRAPKQSEGSRPLFSVAWIYIYGSTALACAFLLLYGLFSSLDDEEDVFGGLVFVAAAFLMSGAWVPVFQLGALGDRNQLTWVFSVAAGLVGLCAIFALVGAGIVNGFDRGPGFAFFVAVPLGVFAGWLIVATAIGIVFAIDAYDRGLDEDTEPTPGCAPLATAGVAGIAAIAMGDPAVVVPSVAVVFFLRQNYLHTGALAVGVVCWLVSCTIVLLN